MCLKLKFANAKIFLFCRNCSSSQNQKWRGRSNYGSWRAAKAPCQRAFIRVEDSCSHKQTYISRGLIEVSLFPFHVFTLGQIVLAEIGSTQMCYFLYLGPQASSRRCFHVSRHKNTPASNTLDSKLSDAQQQRPKCKQVMQITCSQSHAFFGNVNFTFPLLFCSFVTPVVKQRPVIVSVPSTAQKMCYTQLPCTPQSQVSYIQQSSQVNMLTFPVYHAHQLVSLIKGGRYIQHV